MAIVYELGYACKVQSYDENEKHERKTKLSWNNNSFKICDANIEYTINKYIGGCMNTMHVKYQVLDIS
jgi:hypothetical protein